MIGIKLAHLPRIEPEVMLEIELDIIELRENFIVLEQAAMEETDALAAIG